MQRISSDYNFSSTETYLRLFSFEVVWTNWKNVKFEVKVHLRNTTNKKPFEIAVKIIVFAKVLSYFGV